MRQRIRRLLESHPEGLTGNHISAFLDPGKNLGDTLQGMQRQGVVKVEGSGKQKRYFVGEEVRSYAHP